MMFFLEILVEQTVVVRLAGLKINSELPLVRPRHCTVKHRRRQRSDNRPFPVDGQLAGLDPVDEDILRPQTHAASGH